MVRKLTRILYPPRGGRRPVGPGEKAKNWLERNSVTNAKLTLVSDAIFPFADNIDVANEYCCGAMTLEGAPHLSEDHLSVFDCANPCGRKGKRFLSWKSHILMMAAAHTA